jgi:hypothetical protein
MLFFPREKAKAKEFKFKRRTQSEERRKIGSGTSKNSLSKLGGQRTRNSEKLPRPKMSGSLESSPQKNKKVTYIEEDIPNERSYNEDNHEAARNNEKYSNIMGTDKNGEASGKKLAHTGSQEEEQKNSAEKQDEKQKKKKKKNNCFGFLLKVHKDKKVGLEIFNGANENNGIKINNQQDLNQLGPEILQEIMQKKEDEMHKDSSSDSDDEHLELPDTTLKKIVYIPCLFLPAEIDTPRTLLYFHGNGEDIYQSMELLRSLHKNLMVIQII